MTNEQAEIIAELGAELIRAEDALALLRECEYAPRRTLNDLVALIATLEGEVATLACDCVTCGGEGVLYNDNPPAAAWICHTCNGDGVVTAEEARRIGSMLLAELAGLVVVDDTDAGPFATFAQEFDDTDIPL